MNEIEIIVMIMKIVILTGLMFFVGFFIGRTRTTPSKRYQYISIEQILVAMIRYYEDRPFNDREIVISHVQARKLISILEEAEKKNIVFSFSKASVGAADITEEIIERLTIKRYQND